MVDASLVAILACPETHQPVHVADEATVSKVNAAIAAGSVKNRDGESVGERSRPAWFARTVPTCTLSERAFRSC